MILSKEDYYTYWSNLSHGYEYTAKEAREAILNHDNEIREHLKVTEVLLSERQKLLDAIPECPEHGKCVPHALDWIEKQKTK